MKYSAKILVLILSVFTCSAELTRQECVNQGGVVVPDIGDGSIFNEDYLCATDGLPPIDIVVPSEGEPISDEGEVCCGGDSTESSRPEINADECAQQGGIIVNDIGDGAIHRDDYLCEGSGLPPIGTVIPREGEPIAREGQVCCPEPTNSTSQREVYTRDECLANNGTIVGDIGDGAIFRDDYVCASNGLSPLGNIIQNEEPFAIEGEVCCGGTDPSNTSAKREEYTRDECLANNGTIVGDIGDGAIFQDNYVCESSGLPPLGNIFQNEESFAIEGEVCCQVGVNSTTPVTREEVTRDECESQGGEIVGDIGDGAIFAATYVCASNGLPPIANIISEEPLAIEGEVCCGKAVGTTARDQISRVECESQGGEIVGDIGDGAVFADDYICASNGEPPLANVVGFSNDEPMSSEGEVCCGPPDTRNEILAAAEVNDADSASKHSLVYVVAFMVGFLWIV